MLRALKGLGQFISVERGFMLFMISVAATLLIGEKLVWLEAIYIGLIVFCLWSAADAMNNICDVNVDTKSHPFRAWYTRNLGRYGLVVCLLLCALTIGLGVVTGILLLNVFILLGLVFGVLYSVPPSRLRQTIFKPVVNFSVGAVPVLIGAAYSSNFSARVWSLVFVVGLATAVNSSWEDLADYGSDLDAGARTMPIVLGLKRGLYVTIIAGYCLGCLMVLVGVMFQLNILYYVVLSALAAYISIRLILKRSLLFPGPTHKEESMLGLGRTLAKDFVIVAIVHTMNLMLSAYLKYQGLAFF